MSVEKLFSILLKLLTLIAVTGIIILSMIIYALFFYQIFSLGQLFLDGSLKTEAVILKALKAIDVVLLGVIFFIIGLGLYELFIRPIDHLPEWFEIKNIDHLKAMLIKVIIVVMGVSFTGRIITWDGYTDLLGYGIGTGVVILALSYFLKIKFKGDEK